MIRHICIVANVDAPHQIAAAGWLSAGMKRHGVKATTVCGQLGVPKADAYACWGLRNAQKVQARTSKPVLIIERGYIGDREVWTSLHWDGLNGRGRYYCPDDGGARWRHLVDVQALPRPTLQRGGMFDRDQLAVIMGQVPGDMSIAGVDMAAWYRAAELSARALGYVPVFRPHPLARQRAPLSMRLASDLVKVDTLASILGHASAVYAYNSNSLTDAAMAGVPIVCGDKGAVTWPIGGQGVAAEPKLDDRTEWLHRMAWRQWLPSEIECGDAWAAIGQAAQEGTEHVRQH